MARPTAAGGGGGCYAGGGGGSRGVGSALMEPLETVALARTSPGPPSPSAVGGEGGKAQRSPPPPPPGRVGPSLVEPPRSATRSGAGASWACGRLAPMPRRGACRAF